MKRCFIACVLIGACSSLALGYTNLIDNGTAITIDTAWDAGGNMVVGSTTSNNTLNIISGGALASDNGYIGNSPTSSFNTVSISGSDVVWTNAGTLQIGVAGAISNSVTVSDGASVIADDLSIAVDNVFNLNSDGSLKITGDYNAESQTNVAWSSGGYLSVGGVLTKSNGLDGVRRTLSIDGGSWTLGGNLSVSGSQNQLYILSGGTVTNANGYIGIGSNDSHNAVLVSGTNSLWRNTGGLRVGATNSANNSLLVADAGNVQVGGDLTLYSDNTISMADSTVVEIGGNMTVYSNSALLGVGTNLFGAGANMLSFIGDVTLDSGIVFDGRAGAHSVLVDNGTFEVSDNTANQYLGFELLELTNSALSGYGVLSTGSFDGVEMTGGKIDPQGKMEVEGDFVLNGGTVYTAQVSTVSHDLLVISDTGPVDLSMLSVGVYIPYSAIDTNIPILVATNGGFAGSEFASTNSHNGIIGNGMLLFDSRLIIDDSGIVSILTTANGNKFSSALAHAGTEAVRSGFGGMKNAVFTRTKQLRRNLVSTAHAISQEAYQMSHLDEPDGPQGPGDQNAVSDWHIWMQYFSGQGDYDAQGISHGYGLNNQGTTLGFDRLFGEDLTLGLNYTYARSAVDTSNGDRLDTETYWAGIYGEWVSKNGLYVDALAGYGRSNYDSVRIEGSYTGLASYRGNAFGAYADVGQYYHYKNIAVSPYVGLHVLSLSDEDHVETEQGGNQIQVDEVSRDWIESAIGLKARHRFDTRIGRFQTVGYAEWVHDFVQDDIASVFTEGTLTSVKMAKISPDADLFSGGIGLSWMSTDNLEIGVGYGGHFNDQYEEHTGSLMLDVIF
ncbi:MAG TPA: autotransporter domain-containing protein [Pontiella sp.]